MLCIAEAGAQSLPDSIAKAVAKRDALTFKLKQKDFKKFMRAREDSLSDMFKPSKQYASDTILLTDSGYNSTFRNAAYQKTLHRYYANRHGAGYLGAMVAGVIAITAIGGISILVRKIF